MFMDREDFFRAVDSLRRGIVNGWSNQYQHENLDNIIQLVTEGEIMNKEKTSLEEDVVRVIKRIKEAKENEILKDKADKLIETLKKEL